MVHRDPVLLSALSGELIKIKAVQLKPAQARLDLDRNGKGGNPNATHLKYKIQNTITDEGTTNAKHLKYKIQIQKEEALKVYT